MSIRPAPQPAVILLLCVLTALAGCESKSDKTTAPPVIAFADERLPMGFLGTAYLEELTVAGGRAPYTFSVVTGDLPLGITHQAGSAGLTFSGTPSQGGTFTFAVTATDADKNSATADITVVIGATVEVAGNWLYHTLVTVATGVCDGEEGDETLEAVSITRNGSNVALSGLLGQPGNIVSGTWSGNRVTLSGSYPEDGGTTTGTHHLIVYSPDLLQGIEDWTWSNGAGGTCPGSHSRVTATRAP